MKKRVIICICLAIAVLALSGCSVEVAGTKLEGVNVVWTPFVAIWNWLWHTFTPGFWGALWKIWQLPVAIEWLAGPLVCILGGLLFAVIIVVIVAVDLVLAVLAAIIWFIGSIFCAIF